MRENTWILVADRARARVFDLSADGAALVEIKSFINPEGRASGRDLTTDRPPRTQESIGSARHAIEPHTSFAEKITDRFAHQLGDILASACASRRCGHLVLIAPPAFLGTLHAKLGKNVRKHLVSRLDKDLSSLRPADIYAHLVPLLGHRDRAENADSDRHRPMAGITG